MEIISEKEYDLTDFFSLINNEEGEKKYGLLKEFISCEDHDVSRSSIIIFDDIKKLCERINKIINSNKNLVQDTYFAKSYSSFNGDNNILYQEIYSHSAVCYYKILGLDREEFNFMIKNIKSC